MAFLNDKTVILLLLALGVDLYGAGLFTWWWKKSGHASFVFMCVTFMFIGDLYDKGIQIYGRYVREVYGILARNVFAESFLWASKDTVSTIASIFVCTYLTLRVLGYIKPPSVLRRKSDGDDGLLCRGADAKSTHMINGPVTYYKCSRCNQEWRNGDIGFDAARSDSKRGAE